MDKRTHKLLAQNIMALDLPEELQALVYDFGERMYLLGRIDGMETYREKLIKDVEAKHEQ